MHYGTAVWDWTGSEMDWLDRLELFYIWFQLFWYAQRWRSQNNLVAGLQMDPRWLTANPSSPPAPAYLLTTKQHRSPLSASDRCKWASRMENGKKKGGPSGSDGDERLLETLLLSPSTITIFHKIP